MLGHDCQKIEKLLILFLSINACLVDVVNLDVTGQALELGTCFQ